VMGGSACVASVLRVLVKSDPGATTLRSEGLVDLEPVFSVDVGLSEPSLFFGLAVRGRRT
jgi:hypothetical protein